MSKSDRIPDAWPFQMSDEMAARFCDLSLSQFRALVAAGRLPAGSAVFGSACIRWLREDLETMILAEFGGAGSSPGAEARPASPSGNVIDDLDEAFGIR